MEVSSQANPISGRNTLNQQENSDFTKGLAVGNINRWLLRFKETKLEEEYSRSQQNVLSKYSLKIFLIAIVPILCATLTLPFTDLSTNHPIKLYVYYSIPIIVFLCNIAFLKLFPQFFEWQHAIFALSLHGLIIWQLADKDITAFLSFSEYYKGFLTANAYIFLYISAQFLSKVFLILTVNVSAIFYFPSDSQSLWVIAIAQIFLMLLLVFKFYNEDTIKRELFIRTRKQNLWDRIIEDFLPLSLFVVKLDKVTQRIELVQANKASKRKLKIYSDDELQRFLDSTSLDIQENTSTCFSQTNSNHIENKDSKNIYQGNGNSQKGKLAENSTHQNGSQQTTGILQKQTLSSSRQNFIENGESGTILSAKPPIHSFFFPIRKSATLKTTILNLQPQKSGGLSPLCLRKQVTSGAPLQDLNRSININFGSQNSQRNAGDKFTLKMLLKSKLLKQTESNSKRSQHKQSQQQQSNQYEDLESFVGNYTEDSEQQTKKLNIKIFCFPQLEDYAVVTIENESAKRKLHKQEKRNEYRANFWKKITYRVEAATCQLVKQLSKQVKVLGKQDQNLQKKLKEILQIGYSLLILTRNANDYLPEKEPPKKVVQDNTNAGLSNSAGINNNLLQSQTIGNTMINDMEGSQFVEGSQSGLGRSQYGTESVMISTNFHGKSTGIGSVSNNSRNRHILDAVNFAPLKELNTWLSVLDARIQAKNIEVFTDVSQNLGNITNDKDKFNRILYNILDNAVKFSPINGKLSVIMEYNNSKEFLEVHVINSLSQESEHLGLSKDLDQGITGDEDQQKIQSKLKLGIPVSKKLLSLVGPYDYFKRNINNESLSLMFSVFTDIEILKIQDNILNTIQKKKTSGISISHPKKSYLSSARNSLASSPLFASIDSPGLKKSSENLDSSTAKNTFVKIQGVQNQTSPTKQLLLSQSKVFLVGGTAQENIQDESFEEHDQNKSASFAVDFSPNKISNHNTLKRLNSSKIKKSYLSGQNNFVNTDHASLQCNQEAKETLDDVIHKSEIFLTQDNPSRQSENSAILTTGKSTNLQLNNISEHIHQKEQSSYDKNESKSDKLQETILKLIPHKHIQRVHYSQTDKQSFWQQQNNTNNQQKILKINFESSKQLNSQVNVNTSQDRSPILKLQKFLRNKSSIDDNHSEQNNLQSSQILEDSFIFIPDEKLQQKQQNLKDKLQLQNVQITGNLSKPEEKPAPISQTNQHISQNYEISSNLAQNPQNSLLQEEKNLTAQPPYITCIPREITQSNLASTFKEKNRRIKSISISPKMLSLKKENSNPSISSNLQ